MIGERVNVHVTHEFKGNTPNVNVTNQYYYGDSNDEEDDQPKPAIIIEKPRGRKLGWGIALGAIGLIGLSSSGGKKLSYIAICLIFIAIAIFLLVSYFKAMKLYEDAVRNATKNGASYREKRDREK